MVTLRDESEAALLVQKIERLIDEVRHLDRRARRELHEIGVDEEELLAMRAALDRPLGARARELARRDRRP